MSLEKALHARSNSLCELCGASGEMNLYEVPPATNKNDYECILTCNTCFEQINDSSKVDANHWRCLNDSMWSTLPAVQVMAWRMLNRLRAEIWPVDLLEMLYLDEETLAWAKSTGEGDAAEGLPKHTDSNGVELVQGDTVILTKDLNVKGSSLVAKRGTAVRNISLVPDNHEQIEGRVNGQMIVILTQFVKKSN
ncbi:MAG: PhnA domain-containing protein [Salinivirgaceae bacterium]